MPPGFFEPPPIALTSLSIRDFRGIDHIDLDFRGPDGLPNRLVVLAGPNGCGKTAILEAALIVAGGSRLAVGPRGKKGIRRGAEVYEILGSFAYVGNPLRMEAYSDKPTPKTMGLLPCWYFSSWRAPQLIGSVAVTTARVAQRPTKNDANRLERIKERLVNAAAMERFESNEPPPYEHVQFPPFSKTKVIPYSKLINSINLAWSELNLFTEGKFAVALIEAGGDGQGAFDVFYYTPGRPRLPVDFLSAGQLEVFLFLSSLVLNKDSEGIVFIDEPELHLDPQWHRPILRSLMKLQPRAQFIVATHSPEIYDAANSYERHFFVTEDDPRAHLWSEVRNIETEA